MSFCILPMFDYNFQTNIPFFMCPSQRIVFNKMQYNAKNTIQYNSPIQYNTIQYIYIIEYNTTKYNAIQCKKYNLVQ